MEKREEAEMKTPEVAIVILNYNSYEDTLECLESLKKINYQHYRVIVVDNGSTNRSAEILLEACRTENTEFIKSKANLGYAGGNNLGIARAMEEGADYICVLNNDVEVSPDFLNVLVPFMEQNREIGVCGPLICEYDSRENVQSSGARINYWIGEVPILNNGKKVQEIEGNVIECDYIGGACMLFRREAILENGYIPEIYFLFFEETEWCARKGYQVICNCNAQVYHKGSVTVSKTDGMKEHYMRRNRILFVRRNANLIQKLFFYAYIICAISVKAVIDKGDRKYLKYYVEGMRMRKSARK